MVRPLLVGNDFLPDVGGIQEYVGALAARLTGAGVVAPAHPEADDAALGYPVWRADRSWLWPTSTTRALVHDAVRAHDADVVVLTAPFPLAPLAPSLGPPVAVVCHGAELVVPAALPGVRLAYRRWLRSADLLLAVSRYTARHVRALVGPDGPPIRLAPPGVDVDHFRPTAADAATSVRRALGVGDAPLVVTVGRLVPRKGTLALVDAMRRVRREVPDARLVVVGDGRLRPRVRRSVRRSLGSAGVMAGRVAHRDLPAVYTAADVAAMPVQRRWGGLEQEGFGIVFVEAQACGVPVVVGRSGGAPETVVDRATGVVVEGTDADAIAAAVVALLTDPARAERMGRAGRGHAETFSHARVAVKVADDLAGLAAGDRPPSEV